jgi:hypothetical protein
MLDEGADRCLRTGTELAGLPSSESKNSVRLYHYMLGGTAGQRKAEARCPPFQTSCLYVLFIMVSEESIFPILIPGDELTL